jgi:hypothetical protein
VHLDPASCACCTLAPVELQERQKDEVPAAGGNAAEADAVLDAAGEEDDEDEDVDMDEVLPLCVWWPFCRMLQLTTPGGCGAVLSGV